MRKAKKRVFQGKGHNCEYEGKIRNKKCLQDIIKRNRVIDGLGENSAKMVLETTEFKKKVIFICSREKNFSSSLTFNL